MVLGNESPKEFWFGVLEDLSQDLGFWSIICVISHVVLQKFWSTINKKVRFTYCGPNLFTVKQCGLILNGWQCFWRYLLLCVNNFCKVAWEITQIMDQQSKSCKRSSSNTNQNSFWDSLPRVMRRRNMSWIFLGSPWLHLLATLLHLTKEWLETFQSSHGRLVWWPVH